ncbi:MAG: hypothetical protein FWD99_10125 [Oscillospiraceae bacterium]|nr:hypothetical protein [Oscillospiraceae bacterium]
MEPNQSYEPQTEQSQEVEAVKKELEAVDKQIKSAVGAIMVIAVINVLFGAVMIFFPDILAGFAGGIFDPSAAFFQIGFGLLYLGLAVGVSFHSRVCAIIALLALVADSINWVISGGLAHFNVGAIIMRGGLFLGIIGGLIYTFKYHAMVKRHEATVNREISAAIQAGKPKMPKGRIIAFAIIACIGLGALAYGAATGAFASGRNFEDWTEHASGAVTMRVPSERIVEETERDPAMPNVTILSEESFSRAVAVTLVTFQDIVPLLQSWGLTPEEAGPIFLEGIADEGFQDIRWSDGTMSGIQYRGAYGRYEGNPVAFRVFFSGDDMYMMGIELRSEDDEGLIARFFDSVIIR